MAFSRRPVSSTSAITEFWSWWQRKGAASVEKAMKRRQPMAIAAEMTKRVRAIDG